MLEPIVESRPVLRIPKQGHEKSVSDYIAQLRQCSRTRDLQRGKQLHTAAASSGCNTNHYVAAALITMYSKCGSMHDARYVFDKMLTRDVVTWSSLILGYAENGQNSVALELFSLMNCQPNSFTYVAALKACAGLASENPSEKKHLLETGMSIHGLVRDRDLESNMVVASTLLDMYSKCGSMSEAQKIFDRMTCRNVVSWNSLLLGYVENGQSLTALELFKRINCEPSYVTFVAVLKALASLASEEESERESCLRRGLEIHWEVEERGLLFRYTVVANTLVDMYSKCRNMASAREVFDRMPNRDCVSWNCLLLGYVENGELPLAMELFTQMDCKPSYVTYVAALKACTGLASGKESEKRVWLEKGSAIHRRARDSGLDTNKAVASTLIDMYSKFGEVQRAREVFESMSHKDVVTWSCMILAHAEKGESNRAMELYTYMDCQPNAATFVAVLKACGNMTSTVNGRGVHARIYKLGLEQDQLVANSLVDFYGRSGSRFASERLFNGMQTRTGASWNSLMAAYSFVGETSRVFSLAAEMREAGLEMDGVSFVSVLTACSHSGRVEDGKKLFERMLGRGIRPTLEHYTCLVDMLARANRLEEALGIVRDMPVEADEVVWTSLLGGCRKWKNAEVGKVAFDALVAGGHTVHSQVDNKINNLL